MIVNIYGQSKDLCEQLDCIKFPSRKKICHAVSMFLCVAYAKEYNGQT